MSAATQTPALDLYAKVEDLLGIEEATEQLHELYAQALQGYGVTRFLDIGCGRGGMMEQCAQKGIESSGIDLSPAMVEAARAKGLDARCETVCEAKGSYGAAVAVFDVLNFVRPDALDAFLDCVAELLEPEGLFMLDINTLHGFANVAEGTMSAEEEGRFLSVDALFFDNELHTRFTLFEREEEGCYRKSQEEVVQYFHPLKRFKKHPRFKVVEQHGLSLYDREDKTFLVLKKKPA